MRSSETTLQMAPTVSDRGMLCHQLCHHLRRTTADFSLAVVDTGRDFIGGPRKGHATSALRSVILFATVLGELSRTSNRTHNGLFVSRQGLLRVT